MNMKGTVILTGKNNSIDDIVKIASGDFKCSLDEEAMRRVNASRENFEKIAEQVPIYGVTTGYGEMVHILIDRDKETELQTNLVRSHCAAVGPCFSKFESRAIMAARINALLRGYSAVRPEILRRLEMYLNEDIVPVIPEIGSLGASGDLGPLSHIAITLIGEGYVFDDSGCKVETSKVLKSKGIKPLTLKFKEGLSLINGTSAMTGIGSIVLDKAFQQVRQAELITALVLESQEASSSPFAKSGHDVARPHVGQRDCAENMRNFISDSKLVVSHEALRMELDKNSKNVVNSQSTEIFLQKAYSLRCIPQFIGAIRDSLYHSKRILEIEINSSNDNPLFFDNEEVFHGGNFHGQPIATIMDLSCIALTQLGIISERRLNRLLNRHLNNGLPEFLVKINPGLNCGFAGAQYPATALIAENRTICSPASIQSVPSNGDNQDVVSMGLIAARNAKRVLNNNWYILAVELLAGAQAIDIKECYSKLSTVGKIIYDFTRDKVATLNDDRYMSDDIELIAGALRSGELMECVRATGIDIL